MKKPVLWGIHADKTGDADTLFLKKNVAGEYGMLVTLGTFSPPARNFARSNTNLRLVDGEELVSMILAHYEQFDSSYKGILPLKRVYVPEPLSPKD